MGRQRPPSPVPHSYHPFRGLPSPFSVTAGRMNTSSHLPKTATSFGKLHPREGGLARCEGRNFMCQARSQAAADAPWGGPLPSSLRNRAAPTLLETGRNCSWSNRIWISGVGTGPKFVTRTPDVDQSLVVAAWTTSDLVHAPAELALSAGGTKERDPWRLAELGLVSAARPSHPTKPARAAALGTADACRPTAVARCLHHAPSSRSHRDVGADGRLLAERLRQVRFRVRWAARGRAAVGLAVSVAEAHRCRSRLAGTWFCRPPAARRTLTGRTGMVVDPTGGIASF